MDGRYRVSHIKKGNKSDCGNYHAIILLSAAYKIPSQVLCRRISPIAREVVGQYQARFMGERATTDQMIAIRQVLQKCREYNVPKHHLFIDLETNQPRAESLSNKDKSIKSNCSSILNRRMIQSDTIRLIKATMDRVMCVVRVSGTLSSPFESRRGLRQGDGLSCSLFKIVLEGVIRRAGINTRGTIFKKLLGYADDIDIIARKFETMVAPGRNRHGDITNFYRR